MALLGIVQAPDNRGQLCEPPPAKFVQFVENSWLQSLEDHAVGTLHLPVRLWVRHSRPVHTYVETITERQELLACELGAVVGDDRVRDLLSVKTHWRVATGNTKSREVTGALAGTAPSSTARNPGTRSSFLRCRARHLTYT